MKRYRYEILSGFTGTTSFQVPLYLEASVDEMGIMSGFDGEFEQIEQFANFTYKAGPFPSPSVSPSPTSTPPPATPTVTPTVSTSGIPGVSLTPTPTNTPTRTQTPTTTPSISTSGAIIGMIPPSGVTMNYTTLNDYYLYPATLVDFGAGWSGKDTTMVITPNTNTPNRFTLKKYSDDSLAWTSGWVGWADYWGPWGGPPPWSNPPDSSYVYALEERYYYMEVETTTGSVYTDTWTWTVGAAT